MLISKFALVKKLTIVDHTLYHYIDFANTCAFMCLNTRIS